MDHDTTLEAGFAALWVDLEPRCSDIHSARQAYKNGAAIIGARLQLRGRRAIDKIIQAGEDATLQLMWPWVQQCLYAHPEWTNAHRDAIVAGGFAALAVVRRNAPLLKQLDQFNP